MTLSPLLRPLHLVILDQMFKSMVMEAFVRAANDNDPLGANHTIAIKSLLSGKLMDGDKATLIKKTCAYTKIGALQGVPKIKAICTSIQGIVNTWYLSSKPIIRKSGYHGTRKILCQQRSRTFT